MNRPVPAARQLMAEISAVIPDAEYDHGSPDGYQRYRSLTLDPMTSTELHELIEAIEDERIEVVDSVGKGKKQNTRITFVSDVRADESYEYGLGAAYDVLTSMTDEGDAEPDQEEGQSDEYEEDKYDDEGNARQPRH